MIRRGQKGCGGKFWPAMLVCLRSTWAGLEWVRASVLEVGKKIKLRFFCLLFGKSRKNNYKLTNAPHTRYIWSIMLDISLGHKLNMTNFNMHVLSSECA